MKRLTAACVFVAALATAPARAGLFHDAQAPYPFQNHVDLASPFSFVGATYLQSVGGYTIPASGVLLAPNKVLTSAHVVFDYEGQEALSMSFAVGDDVNIDPWETINVLSWEVHPDYTGIGGPGDLAVLTLADAITTADPVSLYMGEYSLLRPVTMVGYGRPGTVSEGYQEEFDGIRRAGILIPDRYGGGAWPQDYLSGEFDREGFPYYDPLGLMATPGDSGGGWFIENNGTWKLMGLTDINNGLYDYGGRTGALRLDGYNGYRDWVVAHVPEPATASMLLFAGGMLASRRRRAA